MFPPKTHKTPIHSGQIPCRGISLEALDPALGYKDAFIRACDDYNNYGFARSNQKIQVDSMQALKLYRLKVAQQPLKNNSPMGPVFFFKEKRTMKV